MSTKCHSKAMISMSSEVEFWLQLTLESKDKGLARVEIPHSVSQNNFEVLVKTIQRANKTNVDLSPLVNFLKNEEVSFLSKKGWKLKGIEFIIHEDQMLAFLNERKASGVSLRECKDKWPYAMSSTIGHTLLRVHIDGHTAPTRYTSDGDGGYVLRKYYDANRAWGRQEPKASTSYEDYVADDGPKPKPLKSNIKLNKAEGKRIRKDILARATKADVCVSGFKPEFIETLNDKEKAYLDSCSQFQISLMRGQVANA